MERKRDYLDGFLKQAPVETSSGEPGGDIYEGVINALKEIYDPEIPVNIYDLGLIYGVDVTDDGHVEVTMTLTTPHCPVAESMPGEVELRVGSVPGVGMAAVNLVWDPPWDPQTMSDAAMQSQDHTSDLQSLMRTSYDGFSLTKKTHTH